jgi:membrane-bound lytic murein transglycosylase D
VNFLFRIIDRFSQLQLFTLVVCFFIIFTGGYVVLRVYILPPSRNEVTYINNNFSFLGLNIPQNLDFCGEKIPVNNYEIKKNLDKEFFSNSYWKTNSGVLFAKAQKWFPYIEPILKREGVPDDFKYVAIIESHLSNIVSPAGAAGFWQLVPVVALNYGLEVNEYVDERYHVEKATVAACKLFKAAHAAFDNWTLAAAAYNRGIGGIQAAIKKQNAGSYYQLMLNKETGSFVYRILAYKTLFSSPTHFGIKKKKWQYLSPVPYKTYLVDSTVSDLASVARHIGCSKATVKFFNPWILQDALPNPEKRTYVIRIPKNLKEDYSSYIKDLKGVDGDLAMDPEQVPAPAIIEADSLLTQNTTIHVVKEKENLKSLAEFYKVKEEQLRKWNNLDEKQEAVTGQTLYIITKKD